MNVIISHVSCTATCLYVLGGGQIVVDKKCLFPDFCCFVLFSSIDQLHIGKNAQASYFLKESCCCKWGCSIPFLLFMTMDREPVVQYPTLRGSSVPRLLPPNAVYPTPVQCWSYHLTRDSELDTQLKLTNAKRWENFNLKPHSSV